MTTEHDDSLIESTDDTSADPKALRAQIVKVADEAEATTTAVMARMLGLELRGRSLNRRIDAALERRGLHRVRLERTVPASVPPRAA